MRDTWEMLEKKLNGLQPDLKIKIRDSISGGQSGADVLLAACELENEPQLAVLKLASRNQCDREKAGDENARKSWLSAHVPTRLEELGEIDNKRVLLYSLANQRLEDCQTLEKVLRDSIPYAEQHIIPALVSLYVNEARRHWDVCSTTTPLDCFKLPIHDHLGAEWLHRWTESQLPGPDFGAFVLDECGERLPNPVAYLLDERVWRENGQTRISIPWMQQHGDLNPRNVLCPPVHRWMAESIAGATIEQLSQWIRLIDMPFCRRAPFIYDLAFLCSAFRFLLPKFDSQTHKNIVTNAFSSGVAAVVGGVQPVGVPADAANFVRSVSRLVRCVTASQPRIREDVEIAFLSCLAGASLWRATKAIDRQKREDRNRTDALCLLTLSAMALKKILSLASDRLPGPDFGLTSGLPIASTWSDESRAIGICLEEATRRGPLVLVLGRAWCEELGLSTEAELSEVCQLPAKDLQLLLDRHPPTEVAASISGIGRLEVAAILDWSVFDQVRETIAKGLDGSRRLHVVGADSRVEDWGNQQTLFYFHVRGHLEELPTVSLKPRERNRLRQQFRGPLERIMKKRGRNVTVCYVGLDDADVRETHEYLEEIWRNQLQGIYIGPRPNAALQEYLADYEMKILPGSIADFAAAVGDVAPQAITSREEMVERVLRAADVSRDDHGELVHTPGQTFICAVPEGEYLAIGRAGRLLLVNNLKQFSLDGDKQARDFLIGHRIQLHHVHAGVLVERTHFPAYLAEVRQLLSENRSIIWTIPARPGAGSSTGLFWLAYQTAYVLDVPTLILETGGNVAFEAIERMYRLIGRSFVVVAEPEDVPPDEQSALQTRCALQRYPAVFVSSRRVFRTPAAGGTPLLDVALEGTERIGLLERLGRYVAGVDLNRLSRSPSQSLFLLLLEAFGGEKFRLNTFVTGLLSPLDQSQRMLLATVAFISRYAHRACSEELLAAFLDEDESDVREALEPFNQVLIIRDREGWVCRHEELSRAVLEYSLSGEIRGSDSWRYRLAEWYSHIVGNVAADGPGCELASDIVWATINPQAETVHRETGTKPGSRLMVGEDAIPEVAMRGLVHRTAAEKFPRHVNIVAHYGKFLADEEGKYAEAEQYLEQARELEPDNHAVLHMLGMRYVMEMYDVLNANPPSSRSPEIQEYIERLATAADHWFEEARNRARGSEYGYTSPIQAIVALVQDEFSRLGIKNSSEVDADALSTERISQLLERADRLVDEGNRHINEGQRPAFALARDKLKRLRGNLDEAISCFERHVKRLGGSHRAAAMVHLGRLYHERGEHFYGKGEHVKAVRDFDRGEAYLGRVMQDPAAKYENVYLWFQCARHLPHWHRSDFIAELQQWQEQKGDLESAFLLMCFYFADAVETNSLPSWDRFNEYRVLSDRRSEFLTARNRVREWLVEIERRRGPEYGILPWHLFTDEDTDDERPTPVSRELRVRLRGRIHAVPSSTKGIIKMGHMGFELFFRPRVRAKEQQFYPSDAGKPVTCQVFFTYEKPMAFDVRFLDK